jgi:UDP-N-acetylglucosamine 1-carboxyvinyltransferase
MIFQPHLLIKKSLPLSGSVRLEGAKNATLVIMLATLLASGTSILENVPNSADVHLMIQLLESLGAVIHFDLSAHKMSIDTTLINRYSVSPEIMSKMRASILAMGPLLARFKKVEVAKSGGCSLGARPIDFHLQGFKKMGATIEEKEATIIGAFENQEVAQVNRIVFAYPSVGATENILMAATLLAQETLIINAALEPEVIDLITVLKKMGAQIEIQAPATLYIKGVSKLYSVTHSIIPDRLEAGSLLLAAAITKGSITLTNAQAESMDVFLAKLEEMGHLITAKKGEPGITFQATDEPRAVSFKTSPYPGFPTDLQAPMMAALSVAQGVSFIEETVFENRLMQVKELQKMGADITVRSYHSAEIKGVPGLKGTHVVAPDIRASCALALAGLVAEGETKMTEIHHWRRGYDALEKKLASLGGNVQLIEEQ